MHPSRAEELVRAGNLDEALAHLRQLVRDNPADPQLRMFLSHLLSVLGQWDRAIDQLNVAAEMNAELLPLAHLLRPALNAEAMRQEVFAGRRLPLVFGEPVEWVGWMIRANQAGATGEHAAARDLRDQALAAAPVVGGAIDGQVFEWLADADERLGPMLEVVIGDRYFWAPFQAIRQLDIDKPTDLRNLVWAPASFIWTNGGTVTGLIPTRYPGSETSTDPGIRLARRTEWLDRPEGYVGLGQRMFATDVGEYALLDTRRIVFAAAGDDASPSPAGEAATPMEGAGHG